jgi:hypothetical protein
MSSAFVFRPCIRILASLFFSITEICSGIS